MIDVGRSLREADPVRAESTMTPEQASAMRRIIVAEAERTPGAAAWWPNPSLVAATVVITLAAGAVVGQRLPRRSESGSVGTAPVRSDDAASESHRQLQFATPGGTRVIWIFDSNFDVSREASAERRGQR